MYSQVRNPHTNGHHELFVEITQEVFCVCAEELRGLGGGGLLDLQEAGQKGCYKLTGRDIL